MHETGGRGDERSGPRERLMMSGEQALSDAELLAVLLGTGTRTTPVAVVAQRLIEQTRRAARAAPRGARGDQRCPGIGPTKACRLRAALELGVRLSRRPFDRARRRCAAAWTWRRRCGRGCAAPRANTSSP